jgi:hypothetical protein
MIGTGLVLNEIGGHVARMGERRNAYRLLAGKPEGKRSLVRPRRRRVVNTEMGWCRLDWSGC